MKRFVFFVVVFLLLAPLSMAQVETSTQKMSQRKARRIERRTHVGIGPSTPLEWPSLKANEEVFVHTGYSCSYNRKTLIPNWVAYELTAQEANPLEKVKGKESFRWDPETNGERTAYREDYKNDKGWQRGHMAPRADMRWSAQAYEESFYLSNICPQNGEFNSGDWATTEKMARRMASRYGSVFIICGPIIGENKYGTLGEHGVVIPDAFFKAFLVRIDGVFHSIAMVLPNESTHHNPSYYWCTVNELESTLGIDLFPGLDDRIEEVCESKYDPRIWGR